MKDFELMFAPMEGYSDPELRELCYKNGADSTFTEMARTSGLARGNKSTLEKTKIPKDIPTYIQILGSNEKDLNKFLDKFVPPKGFLGFNFNLGCPSKEVIRNGLGCALIKRVNKVNALVKIVHDHGYSVSIKLRLGMNKFEKEKKTYLNLIKEVDADFFIVHAKHGKEKSKDPADFGVYKECVETNKVIIANGDIKTKKQIEYLKSIGVKGAMIGRAAVEDPSIFKRLK
ncbi:tRNA-dihydrouridine synthase family protein [Candidatus Woesearchaeota archaeon]|nr:tRNA-dihydrouridine synthase family protein [Candidatus Woesearchaeota archaeon]